MSKRPALLPIRPADTVVLDLAEARRGRGPADSNTYSNLDEAEIVLGPRWWSGLVLQFAAA
jgi:hypothetical protein